MFDFVQDMFGNFGKIFCLNDDGMIFEGNFFVDQGGVVVEVWVLGVWNFLGFDLDDEGNIWEIEMGFVGGDEFNLIEEGGNYGWLLVFEGNYYDGVLILNYEMCLEFIFLKVFWNLVIFLVSMIIYKGDLFFDWKGNVLISGFGFQGLV